MGLNWFSGIQALAQSVEEMKRIQEVQKRAEAPNNTDVTVKHTKDGRKVVTIGGDAQYVDSLFGRLNNQQAQASQVGPDPGVRTSEMYAGRAKGILQDAGVEQPVSPDELPMKQRFLNALQDMGQYQFDPRAGWGNVVNALGAGARGAAVREEQYNNAMRWYEKRMDEIRSQLERNDIDLMQAQNEGIRAKAYLQQVEGAVKEKNTPMSEGQAVSAFSGFPKTQEAFKGVIQQYSQKGEGGQFFYSGDIADEVVKFSNTPLFKTLMTQDLEEQRASAQSELDAAKLANDPKKMSAAEQRLGVIDSQLSNVIAPKKSGKSLEEVDAIESIKDKHFAIRQGMKMMSPKEKDDALAEAEDDVQRFNVMWAKARDNGDIYQAAAAKKLWDEATKTVNMLKGNTQPAAPSAPKPKQEQPKTIKEVSAWLKKNYPDMKPDERVKLAVEYMNRNK